MKMEMKYRLNACDQVRTSKKCEIFLNRVSQTAFFSSSASKCLIFYCRNQWLAAESPWFFKELATNQRPRHMGHPKIYRSFGGGQAQLPNGIPFRQLSARGCSSSQGLWRQLTLNHSWDGWKTANQQCFFGDGNVDLDKTLNLLESS